ncbi:MAG: hypothetical protein A2705_03585 [Omnitrophica WOR_2 bacterium RIFCSPHIGHO2_01_FULL_52_10]|nr:MAG: hypothetical protein A2705_03585 [Omnitrophica WOR_2 bacterium RIFCSPHIGHO2_01_FULL_52_10]
MGKGEFAVKRLLVIVWGLGISWWLAAPCAAAPVYGTRLPEKRHLVVGGQTHAVRNRDLEDARGEMSSLQHFLLLSFGITDWLSLDLKGGAGDIEQDPPGGSLPADNGNKIEYPAFVGGGYGFRVRLYNDERVKAVFGFQHISIHPYSVFIGNTKNKAVLDDWQFSLLGSYDLKWLTPYAGAKWSRMDYLHWEEDFRKRKQSDLDKSAGLVVGMDIPFGRRMWLNAEGQFLDSQAVAVSVNYQF